MPTSTPTPDQLAAIVADQQRSTADRNAALAALQPFHASYARRVRTRYRANQEVAGDLISHADLQLWEGKYQPSHGPYGPWCARVMNNKCLDLLRQVKGRTTSEGMETVQETGEPIATWEQLQDWLAPFCPEDLDRVRSWSVSQRLVLLSRSLLWVKAPKDEWNDWAESEGVGLPFPTEEFIDLHPIDRNKYLANALGISLSLLHSRWHRGEQDLRSLRFVKELRPS